MKPRAARTEPVTQKANRLAAFMKVSTAPLHTLTDAMLESIVRSHANERSRGKLMLELKATLTARKAREANRG